MSLYIPTFFSYAFRFFFGLAFLCGSFALHGNPILFPELNLERAICQTLGVSRENLTKKHLQENLRSLDASSLEVRDLTGLEYATNLEILVLRDNLIENVSPISNLAHLRKLDLSSNRIRNLRQLVPLSGSKMRKQVVDLQLSLENYKTPRAQKVQIIQKMSALVERLKLGPWSLRELNLADNRMLGLSGIEFLTDLTFLNVSKNSLIDLEGLSRLQSLKTLYAQENQLGRIESYVDENKNKLYDEGEPIDDQSGNGKRDTDPLLEIQSLPQLANLYLHNNLLKSLDSIQDVPELVTLFASGNKIREISSLQNCKNLIRLSLSDNKISSLSGVGKLQHLQYLYFLENRISDLRPLRGMTSLKELHLQRNQLVEVRPIETLINLEVLSLSYNMIYDIKFTGPLTKLKRFSMAYNCYPSNASELARPLQVIRSQGGRVTIGNQRPRIPEVESLVSFISGYPTANEELGDYLVSNGYNNFMDYIDDVSITDEKKADAFVTWEKTLKNGKKLHELPLIR